MFNAELRTAVATLIFSMILASLGCGTGNQTNTNQTTPMPTPTATSVPSACLLPDPTLRAQQVQSELSGKLGIGNAGNDMQIEVQVEPNYKDYLLLLIEGSSKGKVKFDDQVELVQEYMHEKCIMKIFFVPKGTVQKQGNYLGDDFEWGTCEWPSQPCSDGTCAC